MAGSPTRRPVLPLRDLVVFPGMTVPLIVGRARSRASVEAAASDSGPLILATQRGSAPSDPAAAELYSVGTAAEVLQVVPLPDGNLKVLVEGRERVELSSIRTGGTFTDAVVAVISTVCGVDDDAADTLRTSVREAFSTYARLHKGIPPEMVLRVEAISELGALADTLVAHLQGFSVADRQALLAESDAEARLRRVLEYLRGEVEILQVERKIKSRVKRRMERADKDARLNEQMPVVGKDIGGRDEFKAELAELRDRLQAKAMPEAARSRGERELRKLQQMNPMSAESTVVRNYLDWLLTLPWSHVTEERRDLSHASEVLEADHFGLDKVKDRILEQLAVGSLVERPRGPVLCLVGPPGVGKTSLGKSIAKATARPFVRQSLGGVRDEAEIRGHRRTYIGALPGKILQCLRRAEASNPVFLLDEIDKMSTDFRGDPSAALLEVLDPEQNDTFSDHYLDLDYDLSRVMFICTANRMSGIPGPLRDRMEVIEVPGYTPIEKRAIAERHLLPKVRAEHGLSESQLVVTEGAITRIIEQYTREAGVRGLERELARLCRKVARRVVEEGAHVHVTVDNTVVDGMLGVPRNRNRQLVKTDAVGLVKGLAVTPWGGDVLEIEVAALVGKGKLMLTGRLGDWLKESANAAFSYVRSRADGLGLPADIHETHDLHVHYPGNGLKTDGPSAGSAMTTALVSALLEVPVRADVAMTGEVSLRGRVLQIGGLKEKLLAAWREGCRLVFIPSANERDLVEVPSEVTSGLEIVPVAHMDDILRRALVWPDGTPEILRANEQIAP